MIQDPAWNSKGWRIFSLPAFMEAVICCVLRYLNYYGNAIQNSAPTSHKIVWLATYLRYWIKQKVDATGERASELSRTRSTIKRQYMEMAKPGADEEFPMPAYNQRGEFGADSDDSAASTSSKSGEEESEQSSETEDFMQEWRQRGGDAGRASRALLKSPSASQAAVTPLAKLKTAHPRLLTRFPAHAPPLKTKIQRAEHCKRCGKDGTCQGWGNMFCPHCSIIDQGIEKWAPDFILRKHFGCLNVDEPEVIDDPDDYVPTPPPEPEKEQVNNKTSKGKEKKAASKWTKAVATIAKGKGK